MNIATPTYPTFGNQGFQCGIEAAPRRFKSFAPKLMVSVISAFYLPSGIADSVIRTVDHRSAKLPLLLRQRITELSSLAPNWDGEGAKAIKPFALADVVEALNRLAQRADDFHAPFLMPTFDGLIQMEWHNEKRSLEIEAVNEGWSLVGTMVNHNGTRQYLTADCERSGFERLGKFYDWFLGAELIWPSP